VDESISGVLVMAMVTTTERRLGITINWVSSLEVNFRVLLHKP
jgi:hypothetical protein